MKDRVERITLGGKTGKLTREVVVELGRLDVVLERVDVGLEGLEVELEVESLDVEVGVGGDAKGAEDKGKEAEAADEKNELEDADEPGGELGRADEETELETDGGASVTKELVEASVVS